MLPWWFFQCYHDHQEPFFLIRGCLWYVILSFLSMDRPNKVQLATYPFSRLFLEYSRRTGFWSRLNTKCKQGLRYFSLILPFIFCTHVQTRIFYTASIPKSPYEHNEFASRIMKYGVLSKLNWFMYVATFEPCTMDTELQICCTWYYTCS